MVLSLQPSRRHGTRRSIGIALLMLVGGTLIPAGPALAAPVSAGVTQSASAEVALMSAAAARPVLRQGSRGASVTYLQQRLVALHYDVGSVDGIFGAQTYHGVVAFQKVNSLARDGIVGARTWAALDRPVVPRPRYSHSGYSVEVNLTKQVVYLARQGAVVRIYNSSTGKASTPTPTGNFTVNRRIDGWRQSSLGLLWRPNYFYQGYAVHGSTSVPNYPASHGCVRLTVQAMNRLWPILRIGTPVHLYR
jgi:peptidoglycan hydrolase-like protein with peptidoglycan-binding domain